MTYQTRKDLVQGLANAIPDSDIDKIAAEGYEEAIVEFIAFHYADDELVEWLLENKLNPFNNFNLAEKEGKESWIKNSYNPTRDGDDPEEAWKDYLNTGAFLFARDDLQEAVLRWN